MRENIPKNWTEDEEEESKIQTKKQQKIDIQI